VKTVAAATAALPAETDATLPAWLAHQWEQADAGALKLHVTARALALRAAQPALWREGRYLPIRVQGPAAEHLVAYARVLGDTAVVTLAARLPHGLTGGDEQRLRDASLWQHTTIELPAAVLRAWRSHGPAATVVDALSGQSHPLPADGPWPVSALFAHQPLALLHAGPSYNA
jgi:(1->4)-alpha-D-glucan 1-alpha-D-glucosylmutase